MKYMNNYYGASRIFRRARCVMPMNLQFFAETDGTAGGGAGGGGTSGNAAGGEGGAFLPSAGETKGSPPSYASLCLTLRSSFPFSAYKKSHALLHGPLYSILFKNQSHCCSSFGYSSKML